MCDLKYVEKMPKGVQITEVKFIWKKKILKIMERKASIAFQGEEEKEP